MRANFACNFAQLFTKTIHFKTMFCWNTSENDKIMLFQPWQSPFLRMPSVVFTGNLLVAVKTASLLVMRWGCRLGDGQSYCRCPVGTHSHVDSQALVDVFLWQLFPDGIQGDFQLISHLRLLVPFQHGPSDVQRIQIWRLLGHSFFSMNPGQFA